MKDKWTIELLQPLESDNGMAEAELISALMWGETQETVCCHGRTASVSIAIIDRKAID